MARPLTFGKALPGVTRLLRFLRPYLRKHKPLLAGSFLALFAGVAVRALEPWPLKFVIDYLVIPLPSVAESGLPLGLTATQLLLLAGLSLVAVYGMRGLCTFYQKVGFALVGNKVLTEVRGALFRHIQRLSMAFHSKARSGDLIFRVINDIGMLRDIAVTAFMPLIGSVLVLVTMAGLMLWINWKLALIVLVSAPLFWLPTLTLSRRIQGVSRTQRKRESAMATMASESINAVQVVQSLALDESFADRFAGQNNKSLKEGVKIRRLLARLQATVQLMTGVSTAAVLFYGTLLVMRGALTAGELLVFLSYLKAAFKPMQDFAKYTGRMAKASAAGERVIQIFETPQDIVDLPGAITAPTFEGVVELRDVQFSYEEDTPVLNGVNMLVDAGQFAAIVGPSGSGKSTIIEMLSRLHDPVSGTVLVDGRDVREYTLESLRSQISVVMQDTLLFATSISENIAYGHLGAKTEEIIAAAKLANAHEFISAFPQGYDTEVGERGVTLSVGQRQRIAIARAVLRGAPLLILDEPTTGLDPYNRAELLKALSQVAGRQTTIMITHDMDDARLADKVFRLSDGKIEALSSNHEMLNHAG